jgi:hypothetical protein
MNCRVCFAAPVQALRFYTRGIHRIALAALRGFRAAIASLYAST